MNKRSPILHSLDQIESRCQEGDISLKDIFDVLGPNGHYVLILLFTLPFVQPIPLPGLSTMFGILITAALIHSYSGKAPWLPRAWHNKKLPSKTVLKMTAGVEYVFEKILFLVYPRWTVFFEEPFRTISLVLCVTSAILFSLPLPIPFSNAIPAWVILLQAVAQLERDGLFVLLSYLQALLCFAYFYFLLTGAKIGLEALGL